MYFINAGNLLVGDTLISVNGGDLLVSSCYIEECESPTTVYNFQVEDFHTHFVGKCNVWVHNAQYISNKSPKDISEMTRKQLKDNTPNDWDFQEHNGRIHIKDNNGNYRVRVDVPDKRTPYNHIHIIDENGNPLDINGNIVSPKDPAGHIPYKH